jgi:hypothetical protein
MIGVGVNKPSSSAGIATRRIEVGSGVAMSDGGGRVGVVGGGEAGAAGGRVGVDVGTIQLTVVWQRAVPVTPSFARIRLFFVLIFKRLSGRLGEGHGLTGIPAGCELRFA